MDASLVCTTLDTHRANTDVHPSKNVKIIAALGRELRAIVYSNGGRSSQTGVLR